jgi:hypothetical protein
LRSRRGGGVGRLASDRRWERVVTPIGEWLQAHAADRLGVDARTIQTARA